MVEKSIFFLVGRLLFAVLRIDALCIVAALFSPSEGGTNCSTLLLLLFQAWVLTYLREGRNALLEDYRRLCCRPGRLPGSLPGMVGVPAR